MEYGPVQAGMKVWLKSGSPAMTAARKNSAELWICHWFDNDVRREGIFKDEELSPNDPATPFSTSSVQEIEEHIKESERRLVLTKPQFFENLLAETEGREPRDFQINDNNEDEESGEDTPAFSTGEIVWLHSGGPKMTISRQNFTGLWICHHFRKNTLHEDLYSEEELSTGEPGVTKEKIDEEFTKVMLERVRNEPERFRLIIDEAVQNLP